MNQYIMHCFLMKHIACILHRILRFGGKVGWKKNSSHKPRFILSIDLSNRSGKPSKMIMMRSYRKKWNPPQNFMILYQDRSEEQRVGKEGRERMEKTE